MFGTICNKFRECVDILNITNFQDDISSLAEVHKSVLESIETITTQVYRFRTRNGDLVKLQSTWKAFRNPWTREIEYIIAKNTLVP